LGKEKENEMNIRDLAFPSDAVLDEALAKAQLLKQARLQLPTEEPAKSAKPRKEKKLPRGLTVRGNSVIASFALGDGTIARRSVGIAGVTTLQGCARKRLEFLREVERGIYAAPKARVKVTVIRCTDLWDAYLADCQNRDKRVDRLKTAWTHLELSFGKRPAAAVKTQEMVEYTTSRRAAGIMNGTINRELACLKAAMRHGARSGVIERVPMFPKRLRESKPRQGFVGEPEYALLAKSAKELWLRTFVALGFNFGFRKSEMLNLRVRNIDLLDGWLTVADSKNGESRKVSLTQETKTLLAECIRGKQPDGFVLTHKDGSRISQPRKNWYDLSVACGFGKKLTEKLADGKTSVRYEGLQMHDLRRSAIRRMIRSGISQTVAMRVSGHKTASVFRRYDITDECDLEQAAKLLERGCQVPVSEIETDTKTDTSGFAHS
jgi:integrase